MQIENRLGAYLKSLDKTKEVMLDIQAGIERVMEEYPDYICDIYYHGGVPSIIVTIS